jgi:predicted PurR-regulated permease PerM
MNEQQFLDFMEQYGGMTVLTIAIIIVVLILLGKVWPLLSRIVDIGNAVGDLPETVKIVQAKLDKLEETLNTVKSEVLPNGGSSLRDAVNRTEKQLALIGKIVAKHERDIRK